MKRRHLHLVLALLLPLLALRALLPAGYMPVSEGGELRIAMCSSAGLATPADGDLPAPDADSCPFALAAGMAPPPAPTWQVQLLMIGAAPVAPRATSAILPAIERAQSPRGPPAISI